MTPIFSAEFFEANNGIVYQKALAQFEKRLLKETMIKCHGNQTKAAELLGINRGTLRKKLDMYGLLNNRGGW